MIKRLILDYDEEELTDEDRRLFAAVEKPGNHDRMRAVIGALRSVGSTAHEAVIGLKVEKLQSD